jgi:hypothetical protein
MLAHGLGTIADLLDRTLELVRRYAELLRPVAQFPFLIDVAISEVVAAGRA